MAALEADWRMARELVTEDEEEGSWSGRAAAGGDGERLSEALLLLLALRAEDPWAEEEDCARRGPRASSSSRPWTEDEEKMSAKVPPLRLSPPPPPLWAPSLAAGRHMMGGGGSLRGGAAGHGAGDLADDGGSLECGEQGPLISPSYSEATVSKAIFCGLPTPNVSEDVEEVAVALVPNRTRDNFEQNAVTPPTQDNATRRQKNRLL